MFGCIKWRNFRILGIVLVAVFAYFYQFNRHVFEHECPVVETKSGKVVGIVSLSRGGREYFEFKGIPYAQPPIGELRFQSPKPVEPWTNILEAKNFGPYCPQMSLFLQRINLGSEDCLYLNVYTPARNLTDAKNILPVMVWFYGGMFMDGRSDHYRPRYLLDENIVLVTLNYRLGALGFLNTGDEVVRGNMGLKDQRLALKWVQNNIKFFGGNEKQVTIFGQSAGSASVHYHILSPQSKGLFSKAISQSGVANNPWALNIKPREQAFRLGTKLNCPNKTSVELVKCLREISAEDILETHLEIADILRDPITVYAPTIEAINDSDTVIFEHPLESLKKGNFSKVPWMSGVTSHEGLIVSTMFVRNASLINADIESWKTLAKNGLYYKKENTQLTEEVKLKYFGNANSISELGVENFYRNLTTLFSDRHFFSGFEHAAIVHLAHAPVYAYYYNYRGELSLANILLAAKGELNLIFEVVSEVLTNWFKMRILGVEPEFHGVCHCDELFLIFDIFSPINLIETHHRDYKLSREIVRIWAKFASVSHPSTEMEFLGTKWDAMRSNNKEKPDLKYLIIDNNEIKISKSPFEDRLKFWESKDP